MRPYETEDTCDANVVGVSFEFVRCGIGDSPTPPPAVSISTYDANGGGAADNFDRLF